MIGTAMGAAIAGALFGPVIGVAADLLGHEIVFCAVGGVGVVLMMWTLRTPAAKPLGDGSLRGLLGSLSQRRGAHRPRCWSRCRACCSARCSVLGPLRLDELGAGAAAIGAIVADRRRPRVDRQPARRPVLATVAGRIAPLLAGLVGGADHVRAAAVAGHARSCSAIADRSLGTPVIGLLWAPGDGDAVRRRRRASGSSRASPSA